MHSAQKGYSIDETYSLTLLRADQTPKQYHKDVLLPVHLSEFILISERSWTDIEPQDYSLNDYSVSKQLSTLRHGHLLREDDGAIEFWR